MIIEINYNNNEEELQYRVEGNDIFYAYIENHLIFDHDEDPTPSHIDPKGELNLKLEAYNTENGISAETRQAMYNLYRTIMNKLPDITDIKFFSQENNFLFSLNYMGLKIDSVTFNDFSLRDEVKDQIVFITFNLSWKEEVM
jgi:urate oxidase